MAVLHAHVSTESRDCDGRYSRTYIRAARLLESDEAFKSSMLLSMLPMDLVDDEEQRVIFTAYGFSLGGPTEEGYSVTEVTWCEDDDTEEGSTYRDHSAEAMGY